MLHKSATISALEYIDTVAQCNQQQPKIVIHLNESHRIFHSDAII